MVFWSLHFVWLITFPVTATGPYTLCGHFDFLPSPLIFSFILQAYEHNSLIHSVDSHSSPYTYTGYVFLVPIYVLPFLLLHGWFHIYRPDWFYTFYVDLVGSLRFTPTTGVTWILLLHSFDLPYRLLPHWLFIPTGDLRFTIPRIFCTLPTLPVLYLLPFTFGDSHCCWFVLWWWLIVVHWTLLRTLLPYTFRAHHHSPTHGYFYFERFAALHRLHRLRFCSTGYFYSFNVLVVDSFCPVSRFYFPVRLHLPTRCALTFVHTFDLPRFLISAHVLLFTTHRTYHIRCAYRLFFLHWFWFGYLHFLPVCSPLYQFLPPTTYVRLLPDGPFLFHAVPHTVPRSHDLRCVGLHFFSLLVFTTDSFYTPFVHHHHLFLPLHHGLRYLLFTGSGGPTIPVTHTPVLVPG